MKKFLSTIALFLIPLIIVYGLFGFALYKSGEWRSEEEIVQRISQGESLLMGLAYRDNTFYFKHIAASAKKAKLLVLGTSRSMQFSSKFFNEPSFYNAGGGAGYIHAYRYFLETLPDDALPETLVLVLDQYFFEEGWSAQAALPVLDYAHYDFNLKTALPRFLKDWAKGKFRLRDMLFAPQSTYGIAAVGRGSGFYSDGSYCYGDLMDHPENGTDVGFHDSFDRIARGTKRFEWYDDLYQPSLDEINQLFALCSKKGIQVVAIIPPYAPSVWQRMEQTGKYGYIKKLPDALRRYMEPYGFELYDFTFMPNTLDAEYVDGYHGGDRVYARIALELCEKSSILAPLINKDYLTEALKPGPNPLRLSQ